MNKTLHAALVKICISSSSIGVSGCHFFCMDATLLHPCQTPFSQNTPLLSVPQQQNVTEYWQEDSTSAAIPPPSTFDVTGQHNKIGSITSRAALLCGSGGLQRCDKAFGRCWIRKTEKSNKWAPFWHCKRHLNKP